MYLSFWTLGVDETGQNINSCFLENFKLEQQVSKNICKWKKKKENVASPTYDCWCKNLSFEWLGVYIYQPGLLIYLSSYIYLIVGRRWYKRGSAIMVYSMDYYMKNYWDQRDKAWMADIQRPNHQVKRKFSV